MKIYFTINVEGFHHYPGASGIFEFLKNDHHHNFIIKIYAEEDSSREIEFISTAHQIKKYLNKEFGHPCNFSSMSCEDIGTYLIKKFSWIDSVDVSEDGFYGAIVTR